MATGNLVLYASFWCTTISTLTSGCFFSKRFTASSRMVLSSPTPMCQKVSVFFPLSAEGIQAVKKTKSPTTSNNPGFFMALPLKEEFAYIPKDAYYRNISVSTLTIALLFLFVN